MCPTNCYKTYENLKFIIRVKIRETDQFSPDFMEYRKQ